MIYLLLAAALVVLVVIISSHLANYRARVPQQEIGHGVKHSRHELKQAPREPSDFKLTRTLKWLVDDSDSSPKNKTPMKVYFLESDDS